MPACVLDALAGRAGLWELHCIADESVDYLFKRAVALQSANRRAEAIDVYRQVLSRAPRFDSAWLNLALLYDEAGKQEPALDAFTQFLRWAGPDKQAFIGLAEQQLRHAGRPVPERELRGEAQDETIMIQVERDGEVTMLIARNDAGVEPATLEETLERFAAARTWLDAFLIIRDHPELLSELAFTLVELRAEQSDARAQQNLPVLQRAREIGPEAAFAEMEALSVPEFRLLVRGVEVIQPVIQRLAAATTQEEANAVLDDHPGVVDDPATDVFVQHLRDANPPEQRAFFDELRRLIESRRHVMGEPGSASVEYRRRVNAAPRDLPTLDALAEDGERLRRELSADLIPEIDLDLALVLRLRFELRETPADISRAAELLRDGLQRTPAGSRVAARFLGNLGGVLLRRYELDGEPQHLTEATEHLRAAQEIEGDFSSDSPIIHSTLGAVLYRRVELRGDRGLLAESITLSERAVRASEPHSRPWIQRQLNLVNPLLLRGEAGDQDAIDRALRIAEELDGLLSPDDPEGAQMLLSLGRARRLLFEWTGDRKQIERAQDAYRRLLARPGLSRYDTALARNNLANSLRRGYEATHDAALLDEAIELQQAALEALGERGAETEKQRANLANGRSARFQAGGDVRDAEAAIALYRQVLAAEATGARTRDEAAGNLGSVLFLLGRHNGDERMAREGVQWWDRALTSRSAAADPAFVIDVSRQVGRQCALVGAFGSAASALLRGVEALDAASRQAVDSPGRSRLLADAGDVLQLAAYALGQTGEVETAVVVLEQGRARALRDALHLDVAALDALAGAGRADLASAYATAVRDLQLWQAHLRQNGDELATTRARDLRSRLDALAAAIRGVPGFEGFARAADIDDIRSAAPDATLLYGCVTDIGATLFAAAATGDVSTLQLPEITSAELDRRARPVLAALEALRDEPESARALRAWAEQLRVVADWLGAELMGPACELLARRGDRRCVLLLPGRLGLLPVTAARLDGGRYAIDAIEWSSAPSATARVRALGVAAASAVRSAAIVGDPLPTRAPPLDSAAAELHAAERAFARCSTLTGTAARRGPVQTALANHDVAHFCCHGLNDPEDPLESFLLLAGNERLTLGDILGLRVWNMRLCVLSACDTGVVGGVVPDEVVSFPAGLVQAGAGGVIAAQWPIWDVAAAVLSIKFYELWPGRIASPASAFAETQRWLRTAPRTEIADLVRRRVPDARAAPILEPLADLPAAVAPFANPIDWAGFAYVGA